MKSKFDFGIDDCISDAIQSEVSAEEIYDEVICSIRNNIKHHKSCYKIGRDLHQMFSQRQYFDVVGDDNEILIQDEPKRQGNITKINIAVPNHPDYTEL
tara:strand:- start:264 stop:560 length:297 start_codon:yes stop_codon:yes gene_type:complete